MVFMKFSHCYNNHIPGEGDDMMHYVLSCCSTADLSKEHFQNRDIHYICFHYEMDGVQYADDLGESMPFDQFIRPWPTARTPRPLR